ncbi:hypothetical protein RRF57_011745 [Xylaria bambusicola]|uniref:Uncharacterized protein n=1 Tax=Xylaria bambusicola TaxID=326684 RepID=A0AAN7UYL1_9PEZI
MFKLANLRVLQNNWDDDEALSSIASAINALEKSDNNCEPVLLACALFLKSFILEDIASLRSVPSKDTEADRFRKLAMERVMERPKGTGLETFSTEKDIDRLVQPDYR